MNQMKFNKIAIVIILVTSALSLFFSVAYGVEYGNRSITNDTVQVQVEKVCEELRVFEYLDDIKMEMIALGCK